MFFVQSSPHLNRYRIPLKLFYIRWLHEMGAHQSNYFHIRLQLSHRLERDPPPYAKAMLDNYERRVQARIRAARHINDLDVSPVSHENDCHETYYAGRPGSSEVTL